LDSLIAMAAPLDSGKIKKKAVPMHRKSLNLWT
jgi:hypothetical protein